MMLVLPLLAGEGIRTSWSPVTIVAVAVGVVAAIVVGTKWIAPRLLNEAARTRSADVFLMAVVTICFAVAALSASIGLSLALGAFLAGLIISESEFSHQALGYILPFRNLLVAFFFVSVGMLLDLGFLADYWWVVILGTIGLMVLKSVTGSLAVIELRYPVRVAVGTGLTLSQVGEFSFVLAAVAVRDSLLPHDLHQGFLAVAVLSMAATPIVMAQIPRLSRVLERVKPSGRLGRSGAEPDQSRLSDHLIIIGYGLNGRNLARAARESGVLYAIVEMNPQTVRREAREEPIFFGDATNEAVLAKVRVAQARAAVVVIGDPVATRSIVAQLRRLNPTLHIIARTRFLSEVQPLFALGASEVVPEEFETSIQIFGLTARYLGMSADDISRLQTTIREDHYEMLRRAQEERQD
jgi:CPA2 family monovalent cation:H+ antiporter-2